MAAHGMLDIIIDKHPVVRWSKAQKVQAIHFWCDGERHKAESRHVFVRDKINWNAFKTVNPNRSQMRKKKTVGARQDDLKKQTDKEVKLLTETAVFLQKGADLVERWNNLVLNPVNHGYYPSIFLSTLLTHCCMCC